MQVVSNAIIAVTFAGNACATVMVLAITPLVNSVGISHAFLIYTVVTVVTLLLTVLFLICGKQFRVRYASRYYAYARAYKSVSGTTENVRLANHL
jgi:ABC-type transport system involved in cytochrome bd biosynthesis fused ATPase/permease subunit